MVLSLSSFSRFRFRRVFIKGPSSRARHSRVKNIQHYTQTSDMIYAYLKYVDIVLSTSSRLLHQNPVICALPGEGKNKHLQTRSSKTTKQQQSTYVHFYIWFSIPGPIRGVQRVPFFTAQSGRIVAESEKHDGARAFDERGAATYMQQILGAMSHLG